MSRAHKIHNKEGMYFITFATVDWVDIFTRKIYKDIVVNSLVYCQQNKGLILYAWCLMSNHIHLIAKAKEDNLSDIIRDFKKHTSRQLVKAIVDNERESRKEWMLTLFHNAGQLNSNNKDFQLWRQDNKPIELWSNEVIDQKLDYIHNNPVVEGIVEHPETYVYSSARNYTSEKGLINIELLY